MLYNTRRITMACEKHTFRTQDSHCFEGKQKHGKDIVASISFKDGKVTIKDVGVEILCTEVDQLVVSIKQLDAVNKSVTVKIVSIMEDSKKLPIKLNGILGETLELEYDDEYIPEKKSRKGEEGEGRNFGKGSKKNNGSGKKSMAIDLV